MNVFHPSSIFLALLSIRGVGQKKANSMLRSIPHFDADNLEALIRPILPAGIDSDAWKNLCKQGNDIVLNSVDKGLKVIDFTAPEYPELLKELDDAPLVLFVKGDPLAIRTNLPVAVIGSRNPSLYTEEKGALISALAAVKSTSVISGLAFGCDTIAHKQALFHNVPTVAVVAHGLDSVYPKANYSLANEIIESGGCLVSEYMLGTPIRPNQFIARDRIQAGLSAGGILLQSSLNGGSMHAMRAFQRLSRKTAVLMPPVSLQNTSEWGGSIELLKSGYIFRIDAEQNTLEEQLMDFLNMIQKNKVTTTLTQGTLF